MNRILLVITLAFIGLLSMVSLNANAQTTLWKEGTHYDVISKTATKKPEIKEFFSFWCPACYQYEPLVAQFKANLPKNVKFTKVHVNFMRFSSRELQDEATKALMIARAMKDEETYTAAIFNYIHKQRAMISNADDLRKIFIVNGADEDKFDKLAASFSVNSLVKRNNKSIDDYRDSLNGVPTFIINGKYKPTFKNDMSVDDMINLVVWLSKQK